ncbi:unnamed protein product [Boreogadus saida]
MRSPGEAPGDQLSRRSYRAPCNVRGGVDERPLSPTRSRSRLSSARVDTTTATPLGLLHPHGAAPPLHIAPPLQLVRYAAAYPRSPPATPRLHRLYSFSAPSAGYRPLPQSPPSPRCLPSSVDGWRTAPGPVAPGADSQHMVRLHPQHGPSTGSAKRLLLLPPPPRRRRRPSCPPRDPDDSSRPQTCGYPTDDLCDLRRLTRPKETGRILGTPPSSERILPHRGLARRDPDGSPMGSAPETLPRDPGPTARWNE